MTSTSLLLTLNIANPLFDCFTIDFEQLYFSLYKTNYLAALASKAWSKWTFIVDKARGEVLNAFFNLLIPRVGRYVELILCCSELNIRCLIMLLNFQLYQNVPDRLIYCQESLGMVLSLQTP